MTERSKTRYHPFARSHASKKSNAESVVFHRYDESGRCQFYGKTYPVRDILKVNTCTWNRSLKVWHSPKEVDDLWNQKLLKILNEKLLKRTLQELIQQKALAEAQMERKI